jgi:hypothetical protein
MRPWFFSGGSGGSGGGSSGGPAYHIRYITKKRNFTYIYTD